MLVNQLGHLKHVDRAFAAEDLLEVGVRIDVPLVGGILQVVFLDIDPQFFDHLGARHRTFTHYRF